MLSETSARGVCVTCGCYPLGAIVESPDGLVDVDSLAERVGKGGAFRNG